MADENKLLEEWRVNNQGRDDFIPRQYCESIYHSNQMKQIESVRHEGASVAEQFVKLADIEPK